MSIANEIIKKLNLEPHPEGGYFRETFRDEQNGDRARSTAILYLLKAGEVSHWHRVDATEVWHWYAGASLELRQSDGDNSQHTQILGGDILANQQPQIVVPAHIWQSAQSLGDWTLVGCTVTPGFEFSGFEMAVDGWNP
ncbi:MAG: cupin domain-containing protein [bacterium]|nr:cupin domain-containing protein [bacterium]